MTRTTDSHQHSEPRSPGHFDHGGPPSWEAGAVSGDHGSSYEGMTPAWIVCSWPPILWQAGAFRNWHFVHLGTRVLNHADSRQLSSGQTVWGNASSDQAAGLAWDWVELPQGVLALADPMGMVSNLQFTDDHGCALPTVQCVMQLNGIVHGLPWQDQVHRLLHRAAA